jgi:hypothetical protein
VSLADTIPVFIAARTVRESARAAARQARDAFIEPAFAAMTARFETLLAEALGLTSQITVSVVQTVVPVVGRTFATLPIRTTTVVSTLQGAPQTVTFTPQLDFREPEQFGLIACAIDFPFSPRHARGDAIAQALTARGIQMRGKATGTLLLRIDAQPVEPAASDLERAFSAWWLR